MLKPLLIACLLAASANAQPVERSQPTAHQSLGQLIPPARDIPFPGRMTLRVDATDVTRGIWRVEQRIPLAAPGRATLLFPKFLPGKHAPRGEIEKLAGLEISANGRALQWQRDPVDVHAFHVEAPAGTRALDIRFQFLSATAADQGRIVATSDMLNLQPEQVSLYPAGWYTRRIPVDLTVAWPAGWQAAGALQPASRSGNAITYEPTDYETLVDSPFFAGRHFRSWDLGHNARLNVVADDARFLAAKPEHIEAHRRLMDQAVKLFGTKPWDRYEFLLALTDTMGSIGLEHHRSSENGVNREYFTEWDSGPGRRNLLPHELVHAWNGKHRRGADSWTPDYRTPIGNSLLWVYEGQTQLWGYVLGARAGMFTKQETLDALATIAAALDARAGRQWKPLLDTTNDPVIAARKPIAWLSQQRSEDYYNEGMLIWLEADAILRRGTGGAKGMDDFAKAFFAGRDGDWGVRTYTFDDVVAQLTALHPHDWRGLLMRRLTETAPRAPLEGLTTAGYRLAYTDTPTPFQRDADKRAKVNNLLYSGGLVVGEAGRIAQVLWESPAYEAGLTVGDTLVGVRDKPYTDEALRAAIAEARGKPAPIPLAVKTGDRVRFLDLAWNGGLRYPRLEKTAAGETSLDRLLEPRP